MSQTTRLNLLLVYGVLCSAAAIGLLIGVIATGNMWFSSLVLVAVLMGFLGLYVYDRVEFGPFSVKHKERVTRWVILSALSILVSLVVYALTGPGTVYVISFFVALVIQGVRPPFERN